jgi:hypothetical protein
MEPSSATIIRWPDAASMSAASSYADLMLRAYAGAGLSNEQIAGQLRRLAVTLS